MSERVIHRLCKFLGGVLAQIAAIALGAAVSVQAQELVTLDGELAIQLWVNTRPGGETIRAGNSIMSPYHLAYFAAAPRSVVGADGTFAIAVLGAQDHYRDDHLQNDIGGPDKHHIVLSCRPVLRGKGQLKRDGTLVVELEWIRGEGRYTSLSNTAGAAVFALPASETGPSSRWELTPHSVQREETAPNLVREVRTYINQRQADVPYVQPLKTTERIEINAHVFAESGAAGLIIARTTMPKFFHPLRCAVPIAGLVVWDAAGWAAEPPDKAPFDGRW